MAAIEAVVSKLQDLLAHCSNGRRFAEVLSLAEFMPVEGASPSKVADALNHAVNQGSIEFGYEPAEGDRSSLLFATTTHTAPSMHVGHVFAALKAVIENLESREYRGGPDPIAEIRQLFEVLGPTVGVAPLVLAMREGLRRKLFYFTSRDTNHYLSLTLSATPRYTVFGLDVLNKQPLCFHVYAGLPEVAADLASMWFKAGQPVLHGWTSGHVTPKPIPGQKAFQLHKI